VKPQYNVSLGTAILQHYSENNVILRLFYMSACGEGDFMARDAMGRVWGVHTNRFARVHLCAWQYSYDIYFHWSYQCVNFET
jgi:hypothetical protein